METVSVSEYAELKGCTVQYVRKLITSGKLKASERFGAGGKNGLSYEIPLAECDPKIIRKYNRLHGIKEKPKAAVPSGPRLLPDSLEKLTEEERMETAFWKRVIQEWEEYRKGPGKKGELDEKYVAFLQASYPKRQFTVRMLYRKKKALKEFGECALADGRGKHENHRKAVPDTVWEIFEYYYLDEARPAVRECIRLTELELRHIEKESLLPLSSESTFAREIERRIEVSVLKYFRFGEKAYKDQCAPYIKRLYTDLNSNDIWVCDNHTFDIFVDDGEHKKPIRVYLTAFLDVRSRKMMGWYVTDAPCSDATLQALRRGIERYGIPKRILSDNGREFLTHDIGGRGFRKNGRKEEHYIPTILDNLQIEFRTAMVRNAKAKIIERAFREVKECFSKLFEGYTGGNIMERPERLKALEKKASNFTPYSDFERYVDVYLEGWFNYQAHTGSGMKGKTRNQVYQENLYELRTATQEELNLMMMRNSRMQKVKRNGLVLRLYGTEIDFWSEELWRSHLGESVYFRYNPDSLYEVRVYDEQDRFLCTAQQRTALSYFASKEQVGEQMREQRRLERTVKAYKKEKGIRAEDALALKLAEAERNLKLGEHLDPKIITPIRKIDETEQSVSLGMAAGAEPMDWTLAVKRFEAAKKGEEL